MEEGYSLIEMLMVLFILAIGLLFAVPSLQQMRTAVKTDAHINHLVRALNYSRVLAITKDKLVVLCPRTKDQAICGKDWRLGINIYLMSDNRQQLHQVIDGFEGADLDWNRNSPKIVFSGDGTLKSQNGSFIYQNISKTGKTKSVILSSTGRVRVE